MTTQNRTIRAKVAKPRASAGLASATAAFALSRGWGMERINDVCGVSGLDLVNPQTRLPDDVLPRLWAALAEDSPDEALCLRMAKAAPFSCLGGLAEGMQYADTLRQAVTLLTKNRLILADRLELELIETEESAKMRGWHPTGEIDQGLSDKMALALTVRLVRDFLGVEGAVESVSFTSRIWGSPEEYEAFFHVPIAFEQECNEIVLRKASLDAPISHANTELFAYVVQHFENAVRRIEREGFPAQLADLRQAIADNASIGEFGGRAAAERAFMSLRSAQRLAADHGHSLGGLIDHIRSTYAEQLLSDPRITVGKVAQLVGYSDARAFRRAFKRWTGQTPSRYRS